MMAGLCATILMFVAILPLGLIFGDTCARRLMIIDGCMAIAVLGYWFALILHSIWTEK